MQTFEDLPYADYNGRTLLLDLYLPGNGNELRPAVIWISGGGWRSCSRQTQATFLVEHGFVLASIDYRISDDATAPANVYDCKAAVRWMRASAAKYLIDTNRIGVFGASAGGHLAALLGGSNGLKELEGDGGNTNQSSDVRAACDFCGPSDLTRIAIPEIHKQFELLYDVTAQYLGGPVEQRSKLARLVSPLTYVSKSFAPILIIHGSADNVVPVEESLVLHEALQKAGTDTTLRVLEGAGHGWDWKMTNETVLAFFKRTLA